MQYITTDLLTNTLEPIEVFPDLCKSNGKLLRLLMKKKLITLC